MNFPHQICRLAMISLALAGNQARADSPKEAMDSMAKAIKDDAHDVVLGAASVLWDEQFRALGFSNLSSLSSGIMESINIKVEYSERIKGQGTEYALFICSIITAGEQPTKYMSSMLWVKEPMGWRYLNLPFKDYTLPPALSVITRQP